MPNTQKILLLVEDNADDAELIQSTLHEAKFSGQIVRVKDGAAALDYLFARTEKFKNRVLPHWVLLDLKLPKVLGLQVLKEIRETKETSKIPVIVFTSSREEQDVVETYRLNVNSYLQKPIDIDRFEEIVRDMSKYWSGMNAYPTSWREVVGP